MARMEANPRLGGIANLGNAFNWSPKPATAAGPEDQLGYNPQLNCGYDEQLRDARRDNKDKLRRRFDHIFEKYERDFEGIGDEIELSTGAIVVDNGHLQNMRHEVDVGVKESSEVQQEVDQEDVDTNQDDEFVEDLSTEYDADSDGDESSYEEAGDKTFSSREPTADSNTSLFEPDESSNEMGPRSSERKGRMVARGTAFAGRKRGISIASSDSGALSEHGDLLGGAADNILDRVPGLKESVLALQSQYKQGHSIGPDAIQALGMSIANQLASFVSGGAQQMPKRKLGDDDESSSFEPPAKRQRRSPSPLPPTGLSPNEKSLWAPGGHPRRTSARRKKDREAPQPAEEVGSASEQIQDTAPSDLEDAPNTVPPSEHIRNGPGRKCVHCGQAESHIWRKGPDGILCNSCGMYLYRYGLMRPLDLPEGEQPQTPEESDGEMDPLLRDWLEWQDSDRMDHFRPIGVQNNRFALEEDALLIRLKEIEAFTWERMATYFPGRSAYALQCRYSKKLQHTAQDARDLLISEGYKGEPDANGITVFSYSHVPFTEAEDERLLRLHDVEKLDWAGVAASMEGRSPEALEQRFHELAFQILGGRGRSPSTASEKPRSREGSESAPKRRYTYEEDSQIVKMREVDRLGWAIIAEALPERNCSAIQKRYTKELCGRHPDSIMAPRKAYHHIEEYLQYGRRKSAPPESISRPKSSNGKTRNVLDPSMATDTVTGARQLDNGDLSSLHNTFGPAAGSQPLPSPYGLALSATERSKLGTNLPPDLYPFTEGEDKLIIELREVRKLGWPAIAEQMPCRSVPTISERYYHSLLPQKARAMEAAILGSTNPPTSGLFASVLAPEEPPEPTTSNRWTTHETDLVVMLRAQGKSWKDIAGRLPGRTARAAEGHYAMVVGKTKKSQRHSLPTTMANPEAPLLKQAVSNSRRLSFSAAPIENGGTSQPVPTSTETTASNRPRHRLLLPSPMLRNPGPFTASPAVMPMPPKPVSPKDKVNSQKATEAASPPRRPRGRPKGSKSKSAACTPSTNEVPGLSAMHNLAHTKSSTPPPMPPPDVQAYQDVEMGEHTFYETPSYLQNVPSSPAEPAPAFEGIYDTPARYNPQSHPYFINPTGPTESSMFEEPIHLAASVEDQVTEQVEIPEASLKIGTKLRARKSTAKSSRDTGAQRESDDVLESQPKPTGKLGSRQAVKTPREPTRKQPTRKPVAQPPTKMAAPQKRQAARPRKRVPVVDIPNQEDASIYELPEDSDDDVTDETHASDEGPGFNLESGAVATEKPSRTEPEASDSQQDEEEQRGKDLTDDHPNEEAVQASPADEVEADASDTTATPPPYSIIELIIMALKTQAPKPMRTSEIHAHLEDKYAWCKTFQQFRARVRTTLSYAPQFEKSDPSSRKQSGWLLTGVPLTAHHGKPLSETIGRGHAQRKGAGKENGEGPAAEEDAVDEEVIEEEAVDKTVRRRSARNKSAVQPAAPEPRRKAGRPRKVRDPIAGSPVLNTADTTEELDISGVQSEPFEDVAMGASDEFGPDTTLESSGVISVDDERPLTSEDASLDGNMQESLARERGSESSAIATQDLPSITGLPTRRPPSDQPSKAPGTALSSSSPILARRSTPARVYSKTRTSTPDITAQPSLLKRVHKRRSAAAAATPVREVHAPLSRASSVAVERRRRVVYTPVRDVDGSEDELA